jgi:hypothetical protein
MRMKKLLLPFALLLAVTLQIAAADESAAIIETTKAYVAANSRMTKITATVEQVADDFARVKLTPEDTKVADPAWVFLQKKDGKWTVLTLGSSFTTEDYQQLGIPNLLRIP